MHISVGMSVCTHAYAHRASPHRRVKYDSDEKEWVADVELFWSVAGDTQQQDRAESGELSKSAGNADRVSASDGYPRKEHIEEDEGEDERGKKNEVNQSTSNEVAEDEGEGEEREKKEKKEKKARKKEKKKRKKQEKKEREYVAKKPAPAMPKARPTFIHWYNAMPAAKVDPAAHDEWRATWSDRYFCRGINVCEIGLG